MNYRRGVVAAGIILLSATLAACGDDSVADPPTQVSAPVVSSGVANPATPTTSGTPGDMNTDGAATTVAKRRQTTDAPPPAPSSNEPQALTLTWTAPEENADGTPLVDLSGYKIRYGTSSGSYNQVVTLNNAGLNRFVVDNLPSGTYYFAITAYNSAGTESQLSGEVSTTL
jgi:hypothetical protein